MKKTIIIIAMLAVVGVGIYFIVSKNNSNETTNIPMSNTQSPAIPTTSTVPVPDISSSAAPENITVSIKNFSFNPRALTIKAGAKVTWVNDDSVPHTVTSDSGVMLNSKTLSPGESFSATFTNPGSANYHCNIHPAMKGSLVIENQI